MRQNNFSIRYISPRYPTPPGNRQVPVPFHSDFQAFYLWFLLPAWLGFDATDGVLNVWMPCPGVGICAVGRRRANSIRIWRWLVGWLVACLLVELYNIHTFHQILIPICILCLLEFRSFDLGSFYVYARCGGCIPFDFREAKHWILRLIAILCGKNSGVIFTDGW